MKKPEKPKITQQYDDFENGYNTGEIIMWNKWNRYYNWYIKTRKEDLDVIGIEDIIRHNFFKEFDEKNPDKDFSNGGWLIEEEAQVVGIATRIAQAIVDYLRRENEKKCKR